MARTSISPNATQYAVQSFTDPSITYTVTEKASIGRPWMCDCKGWIFAKRDPATGLKRDCKHVVSVQKAKGQPMTIAAMGHPTGAKVVVGTEPMRVRARPAAKLV